MFFRFFRYYNIFACRGWQPLDFSDRENDERFSIISIAFAVFRILFSCSLDFPLHGRFSRPSAFFLGGFRQNNIFHRSSIFVLGVSASASSNSQLRRATLSGSTTGQHHQAAPPSSSSISPQHQSLTMWVMRTSSSFSSPSSPSSSSSPSSPSGGE